LPVVHFSLMAHFVHAEDQYLWMVNPLSTVAKRQTARSPAPLAGQIPPSLATSNSPTSLSD
jgi:hypothetical protein